MYKKIFYYMLVVIFTAAISSCGKEGPQGPQGPQGPEGPSGKAGTVVTIVDDHWCIDGVKTQYKIIGEGGAVKVPYIGTDGYWYVDGEKTSFKAVGEPGKPGSLISIGADGYWYIDGVKTDYKATGDPGGSTNTFTVTFDADNGSQTKTQNVINGGWPTEPKDPVKSGASIPINNAVGGLYLTDGNNVFANHAFAGWYNGNELFDFDAPVTKNITLKAKWRLYGFDVYNETTGEVDFEKAITYINSHPETYALVLDNNIKVAGSNSRTLSSASKLTIIGLGAERKISLTSPGSILIVGGTQATEMTLGNNITLVGLTLGEDGASQNNNQSVLRVTSNLTMLEGSKITGNTTVSSVAVDASAAVYVNSMTFPATFTMKGGAITGNKTENTANMAAGLFVKYNSNNPVIKLEGGSITGNSGVAGDVLMERITLTFSGNAQVGTLTLMAGSAGHTTVNIASGWSGDNVRLNLYGSQSIIGDYSSGVIYLWLGKTILEGDVNATTVAKFTPGNFITNTTPVASTQPITNTHYINNSGVLTANP